MSAVMNIAGTLPVLSHLGEMTKLDVSFSFISGTIPPSISILSKLQTLRFYNTKLTGTIPSSLGSLAQLENLIISVNQLIGTIPSTLGSLSKLSWLLLSSNQLIGTIPLLNQSSLRNIRLQSNYLTMGSLAEVPASTFSADSLSSFGTVDLRDNCLKFRHPLNPDYNADPVRCNGKQTSNISGSLISECSSCQINSN